jgi:predicted anti-sigma-YlaC factor YlaD
MSDRLCTYPGRREDAIVDYLYGEADAIERVVFETHLTRCVTCREEIDALGTVRDRLEQWAPPEPIVALDHVARPITSAPPVGRWSGWRDAPVWTQAAAAVLCLGIGAGAANVQVAYGRDGLTVRTGWRQTAPPSQPQVAGSAAAIIASPAAAPSRAELTMLEETLRAEIREVAATRVATSSEGGATGNEALLKQVRTLIANSERRQQLELALRVGDVISDVQAQRRADLIKIDHSIGLMQNSTGMEVLRQREMLNSLAVRVSSQK